MSSPRNITTHTSLILILEFTVLPGSQIFFHLVFCFIQTKWEEEMGQDKRKYLLTNYYVLVNVCLTLGLPRGPWTTACMLLVC